MASNAEQQVSRYLRKILAELPDGAGFEDSNLIQLLLSELECFLPEYFPAAYRERLDGVYPVLARKTGNGEAEIFGLCLFIDQTLSHMYVRLQVASFEDKVTSLECRLGERAKEGMARIPYEALNAACKRLYALNRNADAIDWVFKVTCGKKA